MIELKELRSVTLTNWLSKAQINLRSEHHSKLRRRQGNKFVLKFKSLLFVVSVWNIFKTIQSYKGQYLFALNAGSVFAGIVNTTNLSKTKIYRVRLAINNLKLIKYLMTWVNCSRKGLTIEIYLKWRRFSSNYQKIYFWKMQKSNLWIKNNKILIKPAKSDKIKIYRKQRFKNKNKFKFGNRGKSRLNSWWTIFRKLSQKPLQKDGKFTLLFSKKFLKNVKIFFSIATILFKILLKMSIPQSKDIWSINK